MSKLKFRVVHCSGEDGEFPATELNTHNPQTKGWESHRFCTYPQELGLSLQGEAKISQVQILSHQSKISKKIEMFMGRGNDYRTAKFKRLGYLSLDDNQRSQYQARELKTVYIDATGHFLKLIVHENFVNTVNIASQVGVIAINLLGSTADDMHSPVKVSPGKDSYDKPRVMNVPNPLDDLSSEMNLDPTTSNKLRMLANAKSTAIANEDYATAKRIKQVEMELKGFGSKLSQLESAKRHAVEEEDYDRASELKEEIDEMRRDIEGKIRSINMPGITSQPRSSNKALSSQQSGSRVNVDDIAVGGGLGVYAGQVQDYSGSNSSNNAGKKVAKVEAHMHDDDDHGHADAHADQYDEYTGPEEDRPIRPKLTANYNDSEYPDENVAPQQVEDEFGDGLHPLEGVNNLAALTAPEMLSIKAKEVGDQGCIIDVFGEYRTRCLFSKTLNLREAAVTKLRMMVEENSIDLKIPAVVVTMFHIIRVGIEDKIAPISVAAMSLLELVLGMTKKLNFAKGALREVLDPMVGLLIDKLNDGAAKIRDTARKCVSLIAASLGSIGPPLITSHALRPIPAKLKTAWRPIAIRLQVLIDLVASFGVNPQIGLTVEAVIGFMKTTAAFSHANGEVRDAAKDLTMALQKRCGTTTLEPILQQILRKKQFDEYMDVFAMMDQQNGTSSPVAAHSPVNSRQGSQPEGASAGPTSHNTTPSRASHASPKHSSHKKHSAGGEDEDAPTDFTHCMFCGMGDASWGEDSLDLHYWQDCQMLAPCPACGQVVEIAGLPEHLQAECDHKADYMLCEVTGLIVRRDEADAWKASDRCVPPPADCMYCPLCLASVEDSDTAWVEHLTTGCPQNKRISSNKT